MYCQQDCSRRYWSCSWFPCPLRWAGPNLCCHTGHHQCLDCYDTVFDIIHERWSLCKPVIGLAPPRADDKISANIQNAINSSLRLHLAERSVTCIGLEDFGYNGYTNRELYEDNIHFNYAGVSIYASRLKRCISRAMRYPAGSGCCK